MREQEDYYREQVRVIVPRIQIMGILGACVLALKHPDFPCESAARVRKVCRQLCCVVDRYLPVDVLEEWRLVLWPEGEEGAE